MVAGGNVLNFQQLISANEIFMVPDFQRNYAWKKSQVLELLVDILKTERVNAKTAQTQESHFLGSVIVLEEPQSPGQVQVIDGQQRLTTIFLIISAIRDVALELGEQQIVNEGALGPINVAQLAHQMLITQGQQNTWRLEPNQFIRDYVKKFVFTHPTQRGQKPKLNRGEIKLLRDAQREILRVLTEELMEQRTEEAKLRRLNSLLKTINYSLKVLRVSSDSASESLEIFMTLNSTGQPLAASDLIWTEMYRNIVSGVTDSQLDQVGGQLSARWRTIRDRIDEGKIDQFLRHHILSHRPGSITSKKLFERVRSLISGNTIGLDTEPELAKTPRVASLIFFEELESSSELYQRLLGADHPDSQVRSSLTLLRENLDSYRILALAIFDSHVPLDSNHRAELIRLLEVLSIRWIVAGLNAQKLEDLFQDVSLGLREGRGFDWAKSELVANCPVDELVRPAFRKPVDSAAIVRTVLYRINRVWDQAGLIGWDSSQLHVEHIAPKRSTDHWLGLVVSDPKSDDARREYKNIVEHWGNKTILEAPINLAISQKPFLDKAAGVGVDHWGGYRNSPIGMTNDLGLNVDYWDRSQIEFRSRWIEHCFVKLIAAVPSSHQEVPKFSTWLDALPVEDRESWSTAGEIEDEEVLN